MNDNKPIFTLRDRALSASCFMKTYTRGEDKYTREQINLMPDDLLKLARLCADAYGEVLQAAMATRPAKSEYPAQEMAVPDDDIPF